MYRFLAFTCMIPWHLSGINDTIFLAAGTTGCSLFKPHSNGHRTMETQSCDINGYRLVRIMEDLTQETNLAALKAAVSPHLDNGVKNLALSFTENSYFFSRTIAILVQFLGHIKENDGRLAIIHPNDKMLEMFKMVGLGMLIDLYTSEDALKT
jgi:anti-anti-sigma factor